MKLTNDQAGQLFLLKIVSKISQTDYKGSLRKFSTAALRHISSPVKLCDRAEVQMPCISPLSDSFFDPYTERLDNVPSKWSSRSTIFL